MADVKIEGLDDIYRVLEKRDTWTPPRSLDRFLNLVRKVISSSKYKDGYVHGEPTLEELRSFVMVKARRVSAHPDVEECVDVAAYAYMVFHRLMDHAEESTNSSRFCGECGNVYYDSRSSTNDALEENK